MSCGVGHRHGLDLALLWLWLSALALISLGISICHGCGHKKQKKKRIIHHDHTGFTPGMQGGSIYANKLMTHMTLTG